MDKQELRKAAKEIRRAFPNKKEASVRIRETLLSLPELQAAETVAVYCSMPEEAETDGLITALLEQGKTVCVPLIREKGMVFIKIKSLEELVSRGSFGIREPLFSEESIISPDDIGFAVFPGLAFDRDLNRLGYGGGYYDRYFRQCPHTVRTAVCFSCQIFESVPAGKHDLKMDKIVTEDNLYLRRE